MMLDRENATVTLCNSRTQNLPDVCREADVVVVAMGKMALSVQNICGPVRSSWMWASMSTRKANSAVTSALVRQSRWWRPSLPSPAASAP